MTVLVVDPAALSEYAAAGADRVLLGIPSAGPDKVLPALDRYVGLIDEFG